MKTRIILAVAVVLILAIALTSGASNMGFKLSQTLAANVVKYVSIPYYNSYTTQKAAYLRNDIIAAGGAGVNVYYWTGTVEQRYAGGAFPQVNFDLTPGVGYKVTSTADVSNWVIVGSHNPGTSVPVTANVAKYISIPYHSTSTDAGDLRNELIAAGGTGVNVYYWTGTVEQRYAGGAFPQVNFALIPGVAYKVTSTANIAGWTPAHY